MVVYLSPTVREIITIISALVVTFIVIFTAGGIGL
jgi:hypothetical protein